MKRLSGALLTLLLALFLLPAVVLTLLSFLPSQTAQAIFQQEFAALGGLRLSTEQFVRALSDREYGRQFYNSAMLTGVSLALAMPVALGAGLFLSRLPRPLAARAAGAVRAVAPVAVSDHYAAGIQAEPAHPACTTAHGASYC